MEDDHPDIPAWPLDGAEALRGDLLAAYDDPARGYHDRRHLSEVLSRLDELAEAGVDFDQVPVRLAAWFHDAVYDGERDAEERSATWAEEVLPSYVAADVVAEVARLVRLTETHRPDASDVNGAALSDADLGVLASTPERYDVYASDVRIEYSHLSDEVFNGGRCAVLNDLADRDDLFVTVPARERWTQQARANLARELAGRVGRVPEPTR